jgi:hypothetical protein
MRRPDLIAAILAAALLLTTSHARAQSEAVAPAPAKEAVCSFGAFVTETDPEGLNVRAGPGVSHKILGRLPPVKPASDEVPVKAMVEVEVTAGVNGWFRISNARDNDALTEGRPRPMFKGSGWVSGRKLTVKSQANAGRQRPDARSPVVVGGPDWVSFDSDAFLDNARLIGCSGKWVLVEYGPMPPADGDGPQVLEIKPAAKAGVEGGRFRAWVNRICAMQETSCDGV